MDDGSLGRQQAGGYLRFDAPDLTSAIALARTLKAEGRYKYFRGQRDARWEVVSSFSRVSPNERKAVVEAVGRFESFVRRSPELVPYLQDDDAIIAAAQHHQILPTTFIDFSHDPQVAGWFASEKAIPGEEGAIFMVDDQAEEMIEKFGSSPPRLRFLQVDVANLWRLQAQQGLFLESQTDLAAVWPLDRIVFPHGDERSTIPERLIYPDRRSALEQAIDQYLLLKRRAEAFDGMVAGGGMVMLEIDDRGEHGGGGAPRTASPPPSWTAGPDERWTTLDVQGGAPSLSVEDLLRPNGSLETIIARRRRCTDLLDLVGSDASALQSSVDRFWEGCRPYPFTDEQLGRCLRATIGARRVVAACPPGDGNALREAAASLFDEPIEIEMAISGDASTRAFVAADRLRAALRPETRTRLGLEAPVPGDELQARLQECRRDPWAHFEEPALLELFVDQVVPWQVATRRDPIAFSPFHILTLGRP